MSASPVPETLLGLVQHYSPSGQEAAAVDWLVQRMQALGFSQAFRDEAGNAVGVLGAGPRQIVLLGHIDTVPGEVPVRVEAGCLYGRGSVDAKGPLACFVDAAAAAGTVPGWQIVVIGAVDEERESVGARHVADHYHPDIAIIGEPNRWERIALGYKGSATALLTARQPQAHSAGPQPSAGEVVIQAWLGVQGWVQEFNTSRERAPGQPARAFDQLLLSLRGMQSGEDIQETWAQLTVQARLPLDLPPADWYARLEELAGAAGCSVEPAGFAIPAYQCEKNTPLVRALLSGIRAAGGSPSFVYKTGTADLNIVAPVWDCQSAVYGPGDSALDHTPDEHIVLEDYSQAVKVLAAALRTLTAGG